MTKTKTSRIFIFVEGRGPRFHGEIHDKHEGSHESVTLFCFLDFEKALGESGEIMNREQVQSLVNQGP